MPWDMVVVVFLAVLVVGVGVGVGDGRGGGGGGGLDVTAVVSLFVLSIERAERRLTKHTRKVGIERK